jgi:hypothetical protein
MSVSLNANANLPMKFLTRLCSRRSVLLTASLLLAAVLPARAQNFTLDYTDDSGDLTPDQMYVIFQGSWTGNLGSSTGAQLDTYNGNMDSVYSFQSIESAGGFDVTSNSGTAYILYGNTSLDNFMTANPSGGSPAPGGDYRYSFTEWNFNGTVGSSDITEIDQFGGSVAMTDEQYNGTGYAPAQSFYNTLDTGDAMRAIIANTGVSTSTYPVITSGGNFVSIIGPSKFPGSYGGGNVAQPYPSYTPYLTHLNTIGSNSFLSNNLPGTPYGAIQLNGATNNGNSTVSPNTEVWSGVYAFNATVASSGNIDYNGSVTFTGVGGGASGNIVYNGLYIVMPNDANLTPAIYLQNPSNSTIYGNLSTSNITINGTISVGNFATWGNLDSYINSANTSAVYPDSQLSTLGGNSIFNLKVTGDFEEGLATGFVGSNASIKGSPVASMSSAQWWGNATSAYTNGVQPLGSGYYNLYGVVNFANSANTTYNISTGAVTGNIVGGVIYTSPYDDRFASNLMSFSPGDIMDITALPDGDMSTAVPEPAETATLTSFAVLTGALIIRRRRKSRRARAT